MKYPIGIQNFESLRTDGYAYVDKTASIFQLASTGRYYFLCRPRRFGKSLLLSTMRAYFEGKKELFEGLAIGTMESDWIQYPVLYLDLNAEQYDTYDSLYSILNVSLSEWENIYGKVQEEDTIALRFRGVIRRAFEKTGTKGHKELIEKFAE